MTSFHAARVVSSKCSEGRQSVTWLKSGHSELSSAMLKSFYFLFLVYCSIWNNFTPAALCLSVSGFMFLSVPCLLTLLSLVSYTLPVGGGCRCSVRKVQTRDGASKYPTFGGSDEARMGSEHCLCVGECQDGGCACTLLCTTPDTAGDLNL